MTGGLAANVIAKDADLVIAVGSRLTDFTTSSKWAFRNPEVKMLNINVAAFDAIKDWEEINTGNVKPYIKRQQTPFIALLHCAGIIE